MRITHLSLKAFRGIVTMELPLGPEPLQLFIGANGAGKTSLLASAAVLLSRFVGALRRDTSAGRMFADADIHNQHPQTLCSIEVRFAEQPLRWTLSKARAGRKREAPSDLLALRDATAIQKDLLLANPLHNLPVIVYYPVQRAALDIPLRIRHRASHDPLATYEGALDGGERNFRRFFEWYRNQEDLENEGRIASPEHRDPQLRAVRSAIYRLMPEFSNLRVRRAPLRMEVHKQLGPQESIPLSVAQLSDGEKDLMATVGDLAMRLAMANPGRADPLTGQGLVLWDEFGLHMHPRWQSLAARLPEVFPGCQFLMTSHSPTLLSHAKEARAHLLEQTGSGVRCVAVERPYGMDVNRILEEIMGAPVRPVEIRQRIDQLFLLLDKKQLHQALAMKAELEALIDPDDPALVEATVYAEQLGRSGQAR